MTTVNYANVILKDASGNVGVVRTLTAADVQKVQQVKTDVAQIVDATTHQLITANQTTFGATRIATAEHGVISFTLREQTGDLHLIQGSQKAEILDLLT